MALLDDLFKGNVVTALAVGVGGALLAPLVARVAEASAGAGLDEIGGACFRSDIAAMRHETQYTRLFRT